jgi:hypothetical protein
VCHNPEAAERDRQVRANLVTHLEQLIDGSDGWTARRRDELVGSLRAKPGHPPGEAAASAWRTAGSTQLCASSIIRISSYSSSSGTASRTCTSQSV